MDKKKSLKKVLGSYPIRFADMVIDGDTIWFSACNFNGFFKGSLSKGILEYIDKFPEKDEIGYGLHNFVVKYQGKLFFGPTCSEYVVEYDIIKKQFTYYKVPGLEQVAFPHCALVGQFEKYLIIWNTKNVNVIRFDMEKREFEEVKTCKDAILAFEDLNKKENVKFRRGYCAKEDSIYIPSVESSIILQVNVKKNEKKLHFLDERTEVHMICSDGKKLLIADGCSQLFEWEPPLGKLKRHVIEDASLKNSYLAVCFNECIYFALVEIDEILVYHLGSKETEHIKMHTERIRYNGSDGFPSGTIMIKLIGNEIWIFNSTFSTLQYIKENSIKKQKLELIGNIGQFIWDRNADLNQNYLYENEKCRFQNYLQCTYEMQDVWIDGMDEEVGSRIRKLEEQEFGSIGSKIYRLIKTG